MKEKDGRYVSQLELKKRENLAYYVELEDRADGLEGLVSSLVKVERDIL